ncbi:MAG: flagellar hook-length control protein FliK [Rhizobiaceae bacterium]|nr:flagellar hook-length control protein FliK [Rhizobiaceae bacterium]
MNSISPALASMPTPVKSGQGVEQNSKRDNQSDAKFELPNKNSKGKSETVANQNDKGEETVAKDNAVKANAEPAEDAKAVRNAETVLLELINSYQPKNAKKSEDANDEDQLLLDEEIDPIDETIDASEDDTNVAGVNAPVAVLADQPRSNGAQKAKPKSASADGTAKSVDVKPDDNSMKAEKPDQDNLSLKDAKIADETVKSSTVLTSGLQDKDVNARREVQNTSLVSVDGKKATATVQAEKAMSDGAKDQGSSQKDDRGAAANISMTDKSGNRMAGVEVLEAKTFIAPSNASNNANNISQAILKSQQISSAAAAQSSEPVYQTAQPKALNTLKIQLNPAELGVVTATMKLNGDNLQVQLRVDNIEAYRMLSEDSSSIVKALKGQGFGIDQINLTLATSDRGANQQQGNPQNGQSFQSHTEQEQMRNQNDSDRNSNPENNNGAEGLIPANELAQSESGQDATYSDGVYL